MSSFHKYEAAAIEHDSGGSDSDVDAGVEADDELETEWKAAVDQRYGVYEAPIKKPQSKHQVLSKKDKPSSSSSKKPKSEPTVTPASSSTDQKVVRTYLQGETNQTVVAVMSSGKTIELGDLAGVFNRPFPLNVSGDS